MNNIPRRAAAAGLVALALAVVSACGDGKSAVAQHDGLTTVKVGQLPIVDSVPFKLAVDKGYFKAEGIDARAEFSSPGAMVTDLVNGSAQFALAETALVVTAYSKNLPLRIVGGLTKTAGKSEQDSGGLLVMKNGPVKTAADLNGKTVAVGALKGGGELSLRAALDKSGADSNRVKFLEMPLSDMTAALVKGRVAAISTISPFDGAALAQGATRIMSPGALAAPNGMQVAIATSASFQAEHPEIVKGFLRALTKADQYATAHPEEVRSVLPSISPVPKNLIAQMTLPTFDTSGPRPALQLWVDLMEHYKFVSRPIDVDKLMS